MYDPLPSRYNRDIYRRCGNSGLRLPMISLGLWHNFGGHTSRENAYAMLRTAFDLGITHFDIANNYGPPPWSAEETFGAMLQRDFRGLRDEMIVSTKAGYAIWPGPYGEWGSKKNLTASLNHSLSNLSLDYVDIFYHHRPDPDTPIEETAEALALAVTSGKALYVGVSNYSPEETRAMAAALAPYRIRLLIHQPRYSMFDRHIEPELLDTLGAIGMGAIVFSPLAQGLLSDKYLGGIPGDSRAAKGGFLKPEHVTDEKVSKARALHQLAQARGQSLAQMALAWVLRDGRVTSALIGASKPEQIAENVAALENLAFSAEELAAIEAILAQ